MEELRIEPGIGNSPPDLTDVRVLRDVLRRHGLRPNKAFGQHLLVDNAVLTTLMEAAEIASGESVLEVGAGTGVLTVELAKRAHRVVAVELDQAILPVLRESTARFPQVEILPYDLLAGGPQPGVWQGAVQAGGESSLLHHRAYTAPLPGDTPNPPALLVVMVQKEVAERLTAAPGDMSLLALSVQFYGTPHIIVSVPAAAFYPPPRVDSAIVRVNLFGEPPLDGALRERFFRLARAGFAEKRKQLHNSLAHNLHVSQETVGSWLATAGIDPMRRAETLALDEWLLLTRIVSA